MNLSKNNNNSMSSSLSSLALLCVVLLVQSPLCHGSHNDAAPVCTPDQHDDESSSCPEHQKGENLFQKHHMPENCTLVYAPKHHDNDDNNNPSSWGVFTLIPRDRGTPVWKQQGGGDVVIQLTDLSLSEMLVEQWIVWPGQETGGQDEGLGDVYSLVPGLGMMTSSSSSSHDKKKLSNNILPLAPQVDEGGLTRFDSPGAGAISHYHNYSWFVSQSLDAGAELVMSSSLRLAAKEKDDASSPPLSPPSLEQLKATGYCMDNLRPGTSRLKQAGRGAFATRALEPGQIVAPVPVVPVPPEALLLHRKPHQLLENYCLAESSSNNPDDDTNTTTTTYWYPYGPFVNLINHYPEPNVRLQWSTNNNNNKMMELVAIQPIPYGAELYLDYGRAWEDAWYQHFTNVWKPSDMHYTPSYVMDDAIQLIRTKKEQQIKTVNSEIPTAYPDNVYTSCFYRYSDHSSQDQKATNTMKDDAVTTVRWTFSKGLYELKHLRPCEILQRKEEPPKHGKPRRSAYVVRMLNRPGLQREEIIPSKTMHLVSHVPRSAIRFRDVPGTTDPHLPTAFRHPIHMTTTTTYDDDNHHTTNQNDENPIMNNDKQQQQVQEE